MKCTKCGKELNNNAIFCDSCGEFVMHSELENLPDNGYRRREDSFNQTSWAVVVVITVMLAMISIFAGYKIIENDLRKREEAKYSTHTDRKNPWDKSLRNIFNYEYNSADNGDNSD